MTSYLIRRLLLIIPTLWAILTINFFIVQLAPGGPVEQAIAQMQGLTDGLMERIAGSDGGELKEADATLDSKGARGLDPEVIAQIEAQFGFDKPIGERYVDMLLRYAQFDFGDSLFRGRTVIELIKERLPVSISLGLWSTLIIYLISIPLGIKKAINHGSRFDVYTTTAVIIGYAIPGFLFAFALIVLFAGGTYFDWFPLRGLTSPNFDDLSPWEQIKDYAWHMTLPVLATVIGGFATLTLLTKNSFLDEVRKQYVTTAKAKGLTDSQVLYGHVFRNAMLLIISGFPAALISIFFGASLLIEVMFSLEGLGLLGYESTVARDFPVMFASLYIFTLIGLVMGIVSDLTYTLIDPRIDFEGRA